MKSASRLLRTCTAIALVMLLHATAARAACDSPTSLLTFHGLLEHARATAYYQLEPQAAASELEAAEARLECMSELVPASELTSFYLWYASVFIDLGQEARARAAVQRAASVSGSVGEADPTLSQKLRLMYLEARDRLLGGPRVVLHVVGLPAGQLIGIDGQPVGTGIGLEPRPVGEHFVQTGRANAWLGSWVQFPAGGDWNLRLEGRPAPGARARVPSGERPPRSSAGSFATSPGDSDGLRLELVQAAPVQRARAARRWMIGLGAATVLSAGVFAYEEVLFQSGALISENGVPAADYADHYRVHWASGVAAGVLSAATLGAGLLNIRFGREEQSSLILAPRGLYLSGRW